MMRLPKFRYYAPTTVKEALRIKAGEGDASAYVAGGTDLYPNMKRRQQTPAVVIGLSRIAALRRLRADGDGAQGTVIGACVRLSEIETNRRVRRTYPGLVHAIAEISTPPLRNMGTLGGNLLLDTRCNYYDQNYEWRQAIDFCMKKDGRICWVAPGSPKCLAIQSADSVPVLIALGATAVLASPEETREVPVEGLYQNDGIHYLSKRPGELLTEIRVPAPDGWEASYKKLRRRGAFDFPGLSVGAAVRRAGETVVEARIVLGAVASAPVRAAEAERLLAGRVLDEEAIAAAAEAAAGPSRPMDNTDFSFLWRKQMTKKWVASALRQLARTPGAGRRGAA
ncbi:MAG TPA: FAD binding domain-containing protein [Thermoanaerobaculia bacterium]